MENVQVKKRDEGKRDKNVSHAQKQLQTREIPSVSSMTSINNHSYEV